MLPTALERLKLVSNLERTYGLRMPTRRSWGRTRFWQLLPRLLAMQSSHKWLSFFFSLSLCGAAADQGFGAADRLQDVGDCYS
jgi:hypothetical protein